jgi:hypothetical protein
MDVRRETAIVSLERLDAASTHPQGGVLAGHMVQRHVDTAGQEVIRVHTRRPWLIESVEGMTRFEYPPEALEQRGEPEKVTKDHALTTGLDVIVWGSKRANPVYDGVCNESALPGNFLVCFCWLC